MERKLLTNGTTSKNKNGRWNGSVWYMDEHGTQIPPSVNALIEPVILHSIDSYSNMDKMVYDFVEKFGDEYTDKYGYFQGEDLIFIDAAQYFNISLLDAIWSYKKVDRTLARKKVFLCQNYQRMKKKLSHFLRL